MFFIGSIKTRKEKIRGCAVSDIHIRNSSTLYDVARFLSRLFTVPRDTFYMDFTFDIFYELFSYCSFLWKSAFS